MKQEASLNSEHPFKDSVICANLEENQVDLIRTFIEKASVIVTVDLQRLRSLVQLRGSGDQSRREGGSGSGQDPRGQM